MTTLSRAGMSRARGLTARARTWARGRTRAHGIGLVELLLALAISAAILVAVAYAVDISFRTYSVNQEQVTLMQRVRLCMYRVLTQIRTTEAHQPLSAAALADFKAGRIATDTGIVMMDDAGNQTMYKYDAATKTVTCMDPAGDEFIAVRGVEVFTVKFEPMRSVKSQRTGGAYDLLMRATITMTVKTTGQSSDVDEKFAEQVVTLSSSVVPRCNFW